MGLTICYSKGGCFTLLSLTNAMASVGLPTPIPAAAVIFDSSPGNSDFLSGMRALSVPVKNPISRYLLMATILCVFTVVYAFWTISGLGDPFEDMRRKLLDPSILPHDTPRTYMYSRSDVIVPYKAVETHAAESKRIGLDTVIVEFANTPRE